MVLIEMGEEEDGASLKKKDGCHSFFFNMRTCSNAVNKHMDLDSFLHLETYERG